MFPGDTRDILERHFVGVDCLGNDVDDYLSIFNMAIYNLNQPRIGDKRAFYTRILDRQIRRYKSLIKRRKDLVPMPTKKDYEVEPICIARDQLRRLQKELPSDEFELLVALGMNNSIYATWKFFGEPSPIYEFHRSVQAAQRHAKELLKNV